MAVREQRFSITRKPPTGPKESLAFDVDLRVAIVKVLIDSIDNEDHSYTIHRSYGAGGLSEYYSFEAGWLKNGGKALDRLHGCTVDIKNLYAYHQFTYPS